MIVQIFKILQICKHLVLQYWGAFGIMLKYCRFGFRKKFRMQSCRNLRQKNWNTAEPADVAMLQ